MLASVALVLAQVAVPATVGAPDPSQAPSSTPALAWDDERPRFRPLEYAVTGVTGLSAIAVYAWVSPQVGDQRAPC